MNRKNERNPGALLDPSLLKLVVADDSNLALDIVRDLFESIGAEVHTIASAIGLSGLVRRVQPDAVILDVNMPAIRGDEAIATVRHLCPHATVVLFSSDPKCAEYAKTCGVPWVGKTEPNRLVSIVLRGK